MAYTFKRHVFIPFCAGVLLSAPAASQAVEWNDDVRGWYIGVDRSVGNGCYMFSSFEGGSFLRLGFHPSDEHFKIVFGDDDWKSLEEGKFYPIDVQLGNLTPWEANASVFVWDDGDKSLVANLPFENDVAINFINEFKMMTSISVFYEGNRILRLSLKGSFAAADEMLRCQVAMNDVGSAGGTDPFSSSQSDNRDPFN